LYPEGRENNGGVNAPGAFLVPHKLSNAPKYLLKFSSKNINIFHCDLLQIQGKKAISL